MKINNIIAVVFILAVPILAQAVIFKVVNADMNMDTERFGTQKFHGLVSAGLQVEAYDKDYNRKELFNGKIGYGKATPSLNAGSSQFIEISWRFHVTSARYASFRIKIPLSWQDIPSWGKTVTIFSGGGWTQDLTKNQVIKELDYNTMNLKTEPNMDEWEIVQK